MIIIAENAQNDYSEPYFKTSALSQGKGKPREVDQHWISSKPFKVRFKPLII